MNRRPAPFSVWVFHWLVATARLSGPWRSTTARRRSAISSSASSQVTRSQRPSPRAPARFSGWRTRSGCANPEGAWTPFMQILERRGRGSRAFTRATRPSSTSTCTWQ